MRSKSHRFLLVAGVVLLLLLSAVSQRSMNRDRDRLHLAQGRPLDDAPPVLAFTSMALGGFSGIIANALWIRSSDLQESGKYFELIQLADWITKLQPRFAPVWDFQAWNLAYNVSVKFPQAEERWKWINEGISLIRDQGLRYNPRNPQLFHRLAYLYQHKIGDRTDTFNIRYKRFFIDEMEDLFGGPTINWAALSNPLTDEEHERLRRLKEDYKMEPEFMKKVDDLYGPLEWRAPETHAIYWASRGLDVAQKQRLIRLRRVVYQSLQMLVLRGQLLDYPNGDMEWIPDPNLVERANFAYEQMRRDNPGLTENMGNAHMNFLILAVAQMHLAGREREARIWYKYVQTHYPEEEKIQAPFEEFATARIEEYVRKSGRNKANSVLAALWRRHYRYLADGESNAATMMVVLIQQVYAVYGERFAQADKVRVALPEFESFRQEILRQLIENPAGFSDARAISLCGLLNIPYPQETRELSVARIQLPPQAVRKNDPDYNRKIGADFLRRNGRRKVVSTFNSGLQMEVVTEGEGNFPGPESNVVVRYQGRLLDNSIFDTTYEDEDRRTFKVSAVIPGWREALQNMKPGGRCLIYVPPELAYGETGNSEIPPNAVLKFDLSLLEIK
ncbi:MAG: FKBP-type peptidyl-prolyl cis-trans isomerase [Verrucomicrobiia bacterium]|jgi:FKBP-type peptidyl-prolyl cis-trans isomerase